MASWMRAVAVSAVAVLALSACTARRAPVLDAQGPVGGTVLLLEPEVRSMGELTPRQRTTLAERLRAELVGTLSLQDVDVRLADPAERFAPLRGALLEAVASRRGRSTGLAAGTDLELGETLAPAREAGARTVIVALLVPIGARPGPDGYVPRPPGEIMPLPEDRPDYVVPRAGREGYGTGVELDLAVVDAATGRVLAHRRTGMPAATAADMLDVLPRLVREDTRGLVR